jgi:hypothetical protein
VVKHVAFEAAIARNATIADLEHFEAEATGYVGFDPAGLIWLSPQNIC